MWLPNVVVASIEGPNDGLLPPDAVQWGDYQGAYTGAGRRGISHCDEIDLRRRPLSRTPGDGISDIVDFYKQLVQNLSEKGY